MASFEHMVVYLNFEIVWSYRIALLSSKRVCVIDPLVHLGYPIVFKKIVGIRTIIEGLLLIILFCFFSRLVLIDNYIIPKGAMLISSMDSMHKKANNFSCPESYCPERFINNLKTMHAAANGKLEERDHYAFGWGRRICPGIYLVRMACMTC